MITCLKCGCPAAIARGLDWTCPYCGCGFVRAELT